MLVRPGSRLRLVAVLTAFATLFAASAAQATENVTCSLVSAGPAGPTGDVLEVVDLSRSVSHVYREGDAIIVSNNSDSERAVCSGGAPTVFNIDRIEYSSANGVLFLNYSGSTGPLAPGASAEPGADEIEVSLDLSYDSKVLNVGGTAAAEKIEVGQLGRKAIGVNLNAQADGSAQDADVTMAVPEAAEAYVRVLAKDGDDTLSALGGPAFTDPISVERLVMSGGPGDDVLNGGPFRDALSGNDGDDQLLGGRGRDKLLVGPGRDLALGGKGGDDIENISDVGGIAEDLLPDRIFGGAGNDSISVSQELGGDRVDCGAGRRDDVFMDAGDRARACEDVDRR